MVIKLKKDTKVSIKKVFLVIYSIVCVCVFPAFFLYAQNADYICFNEIVLPSLHLFVIAFFVFCISTLIMRSSVKGTLFTVIVLGVFENYAYIEKCMNFICDSVKYWHAALIGIFFIIPLLIAGIKLISIETSHISLLVVNVALSTMIFINVITASPVIIRKMTSKSLMEEETLPIESNTLLPNIYYFIFDEFSSFEVIEKYYNVNTDEFNGFLKDSNFNISLTSSNPLSDNNDLIPATTVILANLLNLDYIAKSDDTADVLQNYRTNNTLYPLLQKFGYDIVGMCEDNKFVGLPNRELNKKSEATTMEGETVYDLVMKNSALYPFVQKTYSEAAQYVLNWFDSFENPNNFAKSNQFTIAHINFPHVPYLFDENGGRVRETEMRNWDDKQYYKGQYIFCIKKIKEMIINLLNRDPESIIILQSDHSMRFVDYRIAREDQAQILNAVYFQGKQLNIDGLSGINTLITIFNELLGLNMKLREDCLL